jgi:small subunit ribosomal protein S6
MREVETLRTYEALYIVRPDVKDDEIHTIAKAVESLVTTNGGAIVRSETWGKRRLAYEVQHFSEGCYVLLRFTAAPAVVARLENHFRLTDSVIRYIVVYFDARMLQLEAEQKTRAEELLQAGAARRARAGAEDDESDDFQAGPRRARHETEDE